MTCSPLRRLAIAAVTFALLSHPGFAAEAATSATARQLANESMAALKRGDALREGWKPEYEHGIELATQAIAADPKLADAYYALFVNEGRKADRTGLASKALAVAHLKSLLEKTIELDPGHAHAWEARGEMLIRLPRLLGGSASEGEQSLRRAASLAPRWAKPRLRLAELEWDRGESAQAREEAEAARDLARAAGDGDYAEAAEALLTKIGAKGS